MGHKINLEWQSILRYNFKIFKNFFKWIYFKLNFENFSKNTKKYCELSTRVNLTGNNFI